MIKDKNYLLNISERILIKAKKLGATDANVVVSNSVSEDINYRNKKKLNYGSNLSYGGYNKFQWGINTSYSTEKINAQIILQNCIGLIPSLGKSLGIVLNLNWKIK
mgnify:CR=1 FL=1